MRGREKETYTEGQADRERKPMVDKQFKGGKSLIDSKGPKRLNRTNRYTERDIEQNRQIHGKRH